MSSEVFAVALAIEVLRTEGVPPIISDCQAVVQAFANLKQHAWYMSKSACMWRSSEINRIPAIQKVKAHVSQQEAKELGLEEHWFGNDTAY